MARFWTDKLVCYICNTQRFNVDDCQPVNVIIGGYGVCIDHQLTIQRVLNISDEIESIIRERDREPNN